MLMELRIRLMQDVRSMTDRTENDNHLRELDAKARRLYDESLELLVHDQLVESLALFDELLEIRKSLAEQDFAHYGEDYAKVLSSKATSWAESAADGIECQKEAIEIYRRLGLYDSRGFNIGYEDAFDVLGKLYLSNDEYVPGIFYTKRALERAEREDASPFCIGLLCRRLAVGYLMLNESVRAQGYAEVALEKFEKSKRIDPDPEADDDVIETCRQILKECKKRTHPKEFYHWWLV